MNNQEQRKFLQEILPESRNTLDSEALNFLAMLHRNHSAAATTTGATTPPASKSPVSLMARRLSKKRTSPSSSSPFNKKLLSKRTPLSYSPTGENLSPPLQRSFSVPINYTQTVQTAETPTAQILNSFTTTSTQVPNPLSPAGKSKNVGSSSKSASLPPLPPPLRRTASAPIPSDYKLLFSSVTPPRPPAATRAFPNSPISDEESNSSKRLKRMKERMQEMTEWCYQVMNEGDDVTALEDEHNYKDEEESEESVWVEANPGGSLTIHFKCPCGKSYELLLSGNNCYYKLM